MVVIVFTKKYIMSEEYLEVIKNKYVDRYPDKDIPDNFMKNGQKKMNLIC